MPITREEKVLWEAIKRNPRLDNLITYYLNCDEGKELLERERQREDRE